MNSTSSNQKLIYSLLGGAAVLGLAYYIYRSTKSECTIDPNSLED